jgi:hypothetical protein
MSAIQFGVVIPQGWSCDVPSRFHFHTFVESIQLILFALDVDDSKRIRLSNSVRKFSANRYIRNLQQIVKKLV